MFFGQKSGRNSYIFTDGPTGIQVDWSKRLHDSLSFQGSLVEILDATQPRFVVLHCYTVESVEPPSKELNKAPCKGGVTGVFSGFCWILYYSLRDEEQS